jgi:hypothetical protein
MDLRCLVVSLACSMVSLPALNAAAYAQTLEQRVPVTSSMVVSALEEKHLPVDGVKVRLAAQVTAASAESSLEVHSIAATSVHSAQLKLVCTRIGDCLPFFAQVTWPDRFDVISLAAGVAKTQQRETTLRSTRANAAGLDIPAGTDVVLLIEDDRVHVTLHVVALEGGSVGDTIHVATPDHKQRFVASVVNAGFLKGHF